MADSRVIAEEKRPRTAFVLAGGAGLGAVHPGMLQALYEKGIVPDLFVGASAGALNAAFAAARPQTVATAHLLGDVWRNLHRNTIFPVDARTVLGGMVGHRNHLIPDRGLRRLITDNLSIDRIEEALVPLHVIAFDLRARHEVHISEGPVLEALLASSAIPGLLPPVTRGEHFLVDGGVVNSTPVSHAVELGAERIYVLPTDDPFVAAPDVTPQGALDVMAEVSAVLGGARLRQDLEHYAGSVEIIVLPPGNTRHVKATDFGHADALIAGALASARAALSLDQATI